MTRVFGLNGRQVVAGETTQSLDAGDVPAVEGVDLLLPGVREAGAGSRGRTGVPPDR